MLRVYCYKLTSCERSKKDISDVKVALMVYNFFIGPFAAALSKRYTHRKVVFTGGLLASVSMVISTFAPNVNYIIVTFGILTGIGFGLARVPTVAMLGRYFRKHHASANGIAVIGTGGGSFVMAPLIRLLIDVYGWQGTFIVIGGISLNICVCATLLRPIHFQSDTVTEDEQEHSSDHDNVSNFEDSELCEKNKPLAGWSKGINKYFELSLFKNLHFTSVMISYLFFGFGLNIPLVHIVKRSINVGISDTKAPLLLSVLGLCMMIGGLTQGILIDYLHLSKRKVLGCAFFLYGMFTVLLVTTESFVTTAILIAIMGLCRGTFAAVNAPVLKEITGYLYDYTHDYDVSFYVGGASTMLAGIIVLSTHFVLERWQLIRGNESSENKKDSEDVGGKNVLLGQSPHNDRVGEDSEETDLESLDLECVSVTYVERETTV
ncbi:monocarboxylate transporter 12-like [Glandiceps talaboti]